MNALLVRPGLPAAREMERRRTPLSRAGKVTTALGPRPRLRPSTALQVRGYGTS